MLRVVPDFSPVSTAARCVSRDARQGDRAAEPSSRDWRDGQERLLEMRRAFRPTGGVVSGDLLVARLLRQSDQPISLLARWIVERQVVSFEAHGQRWLPVFQFGPSGLRLLTFRYGQCQGSEEDDMPVVLSPHIRKVVSELRGVFDDWEMTQWFATSNSWLGGATPADTISLHAEAVWEAARADRFVAAG